MKKLAALLAGAVLLMGMAASAHALSMQVSTDATTWTTILDNDTNDLVKSSGTIFFYSPLSTVSLPGFDSVQINSQTTNNANVGQLFTNTIDISGGPGRLYVKVSDAPYNLSLIPNAGGVAISGLTLQLANATANLKTYYGNGLFDDAHLISNMNVANMGNTSETVALPGLTNPFSLTEYLTIDHLGGTTSQVTASIRVIPTPEPGTMLLLGAGFLGLAIYGKRRKND